jgi:hypothetical protein
MPVVITTGWGLRENAQARRADTSIEHIPWIVLNPMFLQHRQILIFEGLSLMMLHLSFDVSMHSIFGREANCEGSEAILPSKLADQTTGFIDMFAGICLELSYKLGDCDLGWNSNKQVSMIIEAANLDRESVQVLSGSSHVREDIFSKTVCEPSLAVLGAEDNVVEKLLMSAHGLSPGRFVDVLLV